MAQFWKCEMSQIDPVFLKLTKGFTPLSIINLLHLFLENQLLE